MTSVHEKVRLESKRQRSAAQQVGTSETADAIKKIEVRVAKLIGLIDQLSVEDSAALAGPLASAQAEGRRLRQMAAVQAHSEVKTISVAELR